MLPFIAGAILLVLFYIIVSSSIQKRYYSGQADTFWKCQPKRLENVGDSQSWLPALQVLGFNKKKGREPEHAIYASINLFNASLFAGGVTQLAFNGHTRLLYNLEESGGWTGFWIITAAAILWQSVAEYYWHRLMHLPFMYKRFHKIHHFYTSPEPFDDMCIHPLEAFGYYCILYSPPFILPLHLGGFLLYMAVMGICGILDHSGVKFRLLGIYDAADHDIHHSQFNVNFGFPFAFMDILHGTYVCAISSKIDD